MPDIYPPELTSPVGRVRKYIPDLEMLDDPKNPEADPEYYFSDAEVMGFLTEYAKDLADPTRYHVMFAAADAIDALANNEALVLKKIKTEDLETDGAAVANALRTGARNLRTRAKEEEAEDHMMFDIIPFRHGHSQTVLGRGFR